MGKRWENHSSAFNFELKYLCIWLHIFSKWNLKISVIPARIHILSEKQSSYLRTALSCSSKTEDNNLNCILNDRICFSLDRQSNDNWISLLLKHGTTQNDPKRPKTTQNHQQNHPKPPKTTFKTNKTNQNDPKPATIYPNTTSLRDICVNGRRWCCVTITSTIIHGINSFFGYLNYSIRHLFVFSIRLGGMKLIKTLFP